MAFKQHGKSWCDTCFVVSLGKIVRATSLSLGYTTKYLSVACIIKNNFFKNKDDICSLYPLVSLMSCQLRGSKFQLIFLRICAKEEMKVRNKPGHERQVQGM